jgi:cyclopropane fatty-acyl-phospholipid synthase-like methyltransferase
METKISKRLLEVVDALPLKDGVRILEIGCGPGVAAREIVKRFNDIFVLGVDRSQNAIDQANKSCRVEISNGKLQFEKIEIENFEIQDHRKFDFAFAIRVGALDGRHPEIEARAISKINSALKNGGKLFIDGGSPLKEIDFRAYAALNLHFPLK